MSSQHFVCLYKKGKQWDCQVTYSLSPVHCFAVQPSQLLTVLISVKDAVNKYGQLRQILHLSLWWDILDKQHVKFSQLKAVRSSAVLQYFGVGNKWLSGSCVRMSWHVRIWPKQICSDIKRHTLQKILSLRGDTNSWGLCAHIARINGSVASERSSSVKSVPN